MACIKPHHIWAILGIVLASSVTRAQTNPSVVDPNGLPAQIIPTYEEVGIVWGSTPGSNVPSAGGSGASSSNTGSTNSSSYQPGNSTASTALNAMNATSYGSTAVSTAQQEGVNVESVAAIGQAESRFQNIATANGSSSATGPWQFTVPTFLSVSQQHGLGYTAADISNPQAQAVASTYLMRDYATTVSQAIGQPATTLQTYGAWVFGTKAGSNIATSEPDTPLSSIVSAQSLENNRMNSWTVGQFQQVMGNRLGAAAYQPVLTPS